MDYTLNNPDTLTKYKTAAQISEKVLAEVSKLVVPGAKIVDICQQGDKLIEEEVAKVYRGKKVVKGMCPFWLRRSVLWINAAGLSRILPPHHCLAFFLCYPIHPIDIRRS